MEKNIPVTERKLIENCELILGNSNRRFSGVTSTMLQNFSYQKKIMPTVVMGCHFVDEKKYCVTFWGLVFNCRGFVDGRWRIFHARRNNEVVQALLLKYIFRLKIKIVFTSTAQRQHSRFTRWLIRRVDGLLSTCAAAASYLRRTPDKIIPHGIQADKFVRASEKEKTAIFKKYQIRTPKICGIFGRVRKQKGVHLFVSACIENCRSNLDYSAFIVGAIKPEDKEYVDKMQRQINDANLQERIRFLGEQPFENLPQLFSIMDIVCALSDKEGFGLTILEAMSCEAAVVATKAGAWPEIIREGVDGYVVEVGSEQEITQALNTLMDDVNLQTQFGKNGRARVLEHFLASSEAQALCAYFRHLQSTPKNDTEAR